MNPMTELDVLKGIQASIAGMNLDEPMAVEHALALGASFERSAGRILENLPNPGQRALRAVADIASPELMETTIHILRIDGYGWLPTVTVGTAEVYRGEFRATASDALHRAEVALASREARLAEALDQIEARQVDLARPEVFDIVGFTQTYFNKGV